MENQPLSWWIDKAAKVCGSDRALARAMGVPEHHPHEWKTGKRPMSGESAALMADVLELDGEDARRLVAIAIVENPKNASRAERLKRALFACWVAGVAATLQTPTDASASVAQSVSYSQATQQSLARFQVALARALRRLRAITRYLSPRPATTWAA